MENVGMFYSHLEYITAIWNIFQPFGIFYGHLVYFPHVLVYCFKKNLATPGTATLIPEEKKNSLLFADAAESVNPVGAHGSVAARQLQVCSGQSGPEEAGLAVSHARPPAALKIWVLLLL
jgi:hypothetical protein